MDRLSYIDTASLHWAGYFITGFYENQQTYDYQFTVSQKVPQRLVPALAQERARGMLCSMCLFKVSQAGREILFCIEGYDSNKTYHHAMLNAVDLYFKINYNETEIQHISEIKGCRHKIIPASQSLPIKTGLTIPLSKRIVFDLFRNFSLSDARERFRHLRRLEPLDNLIRMRSLHKDLDLFFVTSYRNVKKHGEYTHFRYEIINEIKKHSDLNIVTGLAADYPIPTPYQAVQVPKRKYKEYLNQLSRAHVAIYTRGLHDCFSSKFPAYLSLGRALVGQRAVNNQKEIYRYDALREQLAYEDPREIAHQAIELTRNKNRAAELGQANAELFDSAFAPEVITRKIIERVAAT